MTSDSLEPGLMNTGLKLLFSFILNILSLC